MTTKLRIDLGNGAEAASFASEKGICLPPHVGRLVMPQQTHTVNVGVVTSPDRQFPETDALVTTLAGVAVGVRTADCVPVLLHAPDIHAVAAIHAGWKGTVGRIVEKTIDTLRSLGADPAKMHGAFGPSICGLCYETGSELRDAFADAGLGFAIVTSAAPDPCGERHFGTVTIRIDLQAANLGIMLANGILRGNIVLSDTCTRHSGAWPSWRRTPGTTDRLISAAWLSDRP